MPVDEAVCRILAMYGRDMARRSAAGSRKTPLIFHDRAASDTVVANVGGTWEMPAQWCGLPGLPLVSVETARGRRQVGRDFLNRPGRR